MEAREVFRGKSLWGGDGEEAVGARKTIAVVPQVLPWLVVAVGLVYVVVTVLLVVAIKIQGVHSRSRDVIRSLATRRCLLSLLGLLLRTFTTRDTSPRVTCLGFLLPPFFASYTRGAPVTVNTGFYTAGQADSAYCTNQKIGKPRVAP